MGEREKERTTKRKKNSLREKQLFHAIDQLSMMLEILFYCFDVCVCECEFDSVREICFVSNDH